MTTIEKIFSISQDELLNNLKVKIDSGIPIIVYGAGNLGAIMASFFVNNHSNIKFVCDKNPLKKGNLIIQSQNTIFLIEHNWKLLKPNSKLECNSKSDNNETYIFQRNRKFRNKKC